ncbi:speckle-type POZ protein B-like [Culex quinquefasciatus]|uniref:speckle-type POZ protein B-like n=1 Tax=Culex quinquefasciatus TaxID=7176 RepID=UPI0018E3B1E5|nr:speckle-type POZ protein B-like [Culex quinquefasciatus]
MSTVEQTCITESKSTVFHNLWKIQPFNIAESKKWQSEVFYGYSSHSIGWEVAWHYVLKRDGPLTYNKGRYSTDFFTLSTVTDFCSASFNAEVELGNENIISGPTKAGMALGLKIVNNKTIDKYLENNTLTLRLKFALIEDSIPQDSQLVANYTSLLSNEELSDVTIQVGPEKFFAQKAILSVRSPVFAAMFQSGMQESTLNRLIVEDIEPDVFKEMLRFVYVGKVERLREMPHELLAAADKYALDQLRKICETHLLGHINKETVLKTLALADAYHAEELKKQSIQFVCTNIKSMQGTDWKDYNCAHPDLVAAILGAMTIG